MENHNCSVCGKPYERKIVVEPEVGQLYICSNEDCKDHAISQLEDIAFRASHQGRSRKNVEYTEWASAVGMIILITISIGVFVYNLLRLV